MQLMVSSKFSTNSMNEKTVTKKEKTKEARSGIRFAAS
jgi:hypothetical protein